MWMCHKMPFTKNVCICMYMNIYIYIYIIIIIITHASGCEYTFFLITHWHLRLVGRSMHHFSVFDLYCDNWYFMQTDFTNVSSQEMAPKKLPTKRSRKEDTGSEVRNTGDDLRPLKAGRSSRRGESSWGTKSTLSFKRKLPGGNGLSLYHPWLSLILR